MYPYINTENASRLHKMTLYLSILSWTMKRFYLCKTLDIMCPFPLVYYIITHDEVLPSDVFKAIFDF